MSAPEWAYLKFQIDLQDMIYYSAPKRRKAKRFSEVDPELLRTFEKLGISLTEQNDYQTSQLMQYLIVFL
jgi:Fe-S cluster assembly protein SufB